jgi:hypothetical protein
MNSFMGRAKSSGLPIWAAMFASLILVVAILGFIMGLTTVVLGIAVVGAVIIGVYGLMVLRKFFG